MSSLKSAPEARLSGAAHAPREAVHAIVYNTVRCALFVAVSTVCVGCGRPEAKSADCDPGFDQSMNQVCNVDTLAKLDPENNLIGIEADRYEWMMEHVKHPDAIELITLMRVESELQRAKMLREALTHTKQKSCSLADHYEHSTGT